MISELLKPQWSKLKWSYASLPSDDHEEKCLPLEDTSAHSTGWDKLNLIFALIACVLSLTLITLIMIQESSQHPQHQSTYPSVYAHKEHERFLIKTPWNYSNPSPCGLSVDSARQSGCKWSAMTFAWYPSECYDEELNREFFDLYDWEWYATEDLSNDQRLPRDAIMNGDIHKAYMSMKYHKTHCMYTFRKLYRALMGFALPDNYILTLGHLEHCERFVLREDTPAVKGVAKFLDCVTL